MTSTDRVRYCFVVAPSGQKGGGMGRVSDYILQGGKARTEHLIFRALDTRGSGSAFASIFLTAKAVCTIWLSRLRRQAALVHVNMGDKGSLVRKGAVVVLARLSGVPVVLHLHAAELTTHYEAMPGWAQWLLRRPFHAATCCVVLGRLWQDWLIERLGVSADKIEIAYNGVPADGVRRDLVVREPGVPRQILFLGNLLERKGLSDLLHALASLPPHAPAWKAILAGGGDVARYRALVETLGLEKRVEFAGWVDQAGARRLVKESDLLALPSYDEGLPLVILEALGSGTPVLCTPVGAIPEVLKDGVTALFAKPGDREGISRNILAAISDDQLLQQLSDEGLALYGRIFTVDAFIDTLFAIYRRHCGIELQSPAAAPVSGRF